MAFVRPPCLLLACCVAACALLGCGEDPAPAEEGRSQTTSTPGFTQFPPSAPSNGGSLAPTPSAGSTGAGSGAASGAGNGEGGSAGGAGSTAQNVDDAGMKPEGPPPLTVCDADAGVDDDAGAGDGERCVVVGDIRVRYRAADTNAGDNQIKPHFDLVNDGDEPVPLSSLTLRYWFEDAFDVQRLVFWCDYAQIGCGSIHGSFSAVDRTDANRALELGFSGGTLAPGSSTGEIQARFNRDDWTEFDESDDPSFDPSLTAFGDAPRVTLYLDGNLIWGIEPE